MAMLLCILFALSYAGDAPKCPGYLTVDITDGVKTADGSITKHNLTYPPEIYYFRNNSVLGCVCEIKACVRKCCGDGQMKTIDGCVPFNGTLKLPVFDGARETRLQLQPFYIIHGSSCTKEVGRLNPKLNEHDSYHLQANGTIIMTGSQNKFLHVSDYCVDTFFNPLLRKSETTVVLCEEEKKRNAPAILGNLICVSFMFTHTKNYITFLLKQINF